MIKTQFQKELLLSAPQVSRTTANKKPDVLKIQSWLNLFAHRNPSAGTGTGIDGDFGPSTEKAVVNYQKSQNLPQTGVVDTLLFNQLSTPMINAFTTPPQGNNLRELIVNTAQMHVDNTPFELVINNQSNSGPWVRAYMDAHEGEPWYWCMGFVQTIIDQAASQLGKDFRSLMPQSYSCDTIGTTGIQKNLLTRSANVRKNPGNVKPGDIFLLQKSTNDWEHTGIIVGVHDQLFETIEGNTNTDGSSNGNGVYKRSRNFMKSTLDVFSIEPLA